MDHTAFLGNTVEKIAAEKAGIIKPEIPVLFCGKDPIAKSVIQKRAAEMKAPLFLVEREGLTIESSDLSGTVFSWNRWKRLSLPLLGIYQTENAQNVLTAVDLLNKSGFSIRDEQVSTGLGKVKWPARYEVVRNDPVIICDGGHNPEGIDAAVTSTKKYFGSEKVLVVTGVMADKDYPYMVSRISEIADRVFCIKPENPRALDAKALADEFLSKSTPAEGFASIDDAVSNAIECARAENKAILCVGSLYMYSQIINAIEQSTK
jgi:dihydrofolate synthase/folylpolyglutamate synthase